MFFIRNYSSLFRVLQQNRDLVDTWNNQNYQQSYEEALKILSEDPLNEFALTVHGFSAYLLGYWNTETENKDYLIEAIFSLRKALLLPRLAREAEVHYVLGKSYFYINRLEDSLLHITKAIERGHKAEDIFEFQLLLYEKTDNYAALIETAEALIVTKPKDVYYLALGRAYAQQERFNQSEQHFYYIIENSRDVLLVERARLFRAQLFLDVGEEEKAKIEVMTILKNNQESDSAHVINGMIYEQKGEFEKARFEWRKALKINPNNAVAIVKLEGVDYGN